MKNKDQRHKKRMERKKEVIDSSIAEADIEKGVVLVLTGNGKGKSSSAFGMVGRALGHGQKVGICQFIKNRKDTGEEAFFGKDPNADWHVLGDGFTWDTQNREQDVATSKKGWSVAKDMLQNNEYDLVILDELTYLLNYDYLDVETVLDDIKARPKMQHVVITGRAASDELLEIADTVSEIADVKHAYRQGIQAQKGIDF